MKNSPWPITFKVVAFAVAVFGFVTLASPAKAKECKPGTSFEELQADIERIAKQYKVAYVTKLQPLDDGTYALYLIDSNGDSAAWLLSKEKCNLQLFRGLKANLVAKKIFGVDHYSMLFPTEGQEV